MPLVRTWRERRYEKRFAGECFGCFRGVYATLEEAGRSAPSTHPVGFNHKEVSQQFQERRDRVFSFDYPVLFWLKSLLFEKCKLFDFGGHVGTQFYAYAKYLSYPGGLQWTVCDLPEITKAGELLFLQSGCSGLAFTNDFADAEGADIMLAAGSIQYIDDPGFLTMLGQLKQRPRDLLINKVPLYDGPPFATLQNGGPAFTPMRVFNRPSFLAELDGLGYTLKDNWNVETHSGHIPFHPEHSFPHHSGLYLRLR